MNRKYWIFSIILLFLLIYVNILVLYYIDFNIEIENIVFNNYDEDREIINLSIYKENSYFFNHEYNCFASTDNMVYSAKPVDGVCVFDLPINNDYEFYLGNKRKESKKKKLLDYVQNQLSFRFSNEKVIMTLGEKASINYIEKFVVPVEQLYDFESSDNNIVSIDGATLVANGVGSVTITEPTSGSSMIVEVTDIISFPTFSKTKKPIIPCNNYSEEEAKLLDDLLSYYVEKAGKGTRAGAVAAARFLTLQLKYRIPYFYENGRVNETGVNLADGEGRYYKEGLYLNRNKFEFIQYKYNGPAIWGCPLRNWDNNEKFGFIAGNKMPNGLDCSGFVSWALKNGGFDPGDYGAGNTPGSKPQMTKLGEYTRITNDIINNNLIKTGDLLNYSGHIAIIIGQDDSYFYVAESLPHLGGVVATKYLKSKVKATFPYVVFMDSYYEKDGNLTDYWE